MTGAVVGTKWSSWAPQLLSALRIVAAAMYCFVWRYISPAGAGPWSLDATVRK